MMIQMECDYVTPSFFRELEREYRAQGGGGVGGQEVRGLGGVCFVFMCPFGCCVYGRGTFALK
jgi:hypothetical protein